MLETIESNPLLSLSSNETNLKFTPFPKIGRMSRHCTITEKIDGTNASIFISDEGEFLVGSRTRWITPLHDNYGFARWAYAHEEELRQLGPGQHFGEWWGLGIQRGYDLEEKRFSLFNANRWSDERGERPACCHVVPVVYDGLFTSGAVDNAISHLRMYGSMATPGFMPAEGVVIYHQATKTLFKKTIEKDDAPKGIKDS